MTWHAPVLVAIGVASFVITTALVRYYITGGRDLENPEVCG